MTIMWEENEVSSEDSESKPGDTEYSLDSTTYGARPSVSSKASTRLGQRASSLGSLPEHSSSLSSGIEEQLEDKVKIFREALVLLPFRYVWQLAHALSIAVHCCLVSYDVAYSQGEVLIYIYLFDVFFVVDWVLHLLFKRLHENDHTVHVPRSEPAVAVDFFTIIPYETFLDYRAELSRLVRLYRVASFFNQQRRKVSHTPVCFCLLELTVYIALLSNTLGVLLYVLSCKSELEENCDRWYVELAAENGWQDQSKSRWYVMCTCAVLVQFTRRGLITLSGASVRFDVVTVIALILYFGLLACLGVSYVTSGLTQQKRILATVAEYRPFAKALLTRRLDRPDLLPKLDRHFVEFWRERKAIAELLDLALLPPAMQRELALDLYWDLFHHSHAFRGVELALLRSAAQAARSEYLPPGERLLARGRCKDRLIYVASGVVQILLEEDDKTPLLALGEGTVLGTASLLFSCPSKCEVRAATSCLIYSLDRREFDRLAERCPALLQGLINLLRSRVREGRRLAAVERLAHADYVPYIDVSRRTTVRWVRKTHDRLMNTKGKRQTRAQKVRQFDFQDLFFTARNIDELALSKDQGSSSRVLCMRAGIPLICNPDSNLLMAWNAFVALLVLIVAFVSPYGACFQETYSDMGWFFLMFVQFVLMVDVFVLLSTAIKGRGELITRWTTIARIRLGDAAFYIDILAAMPLFVFIYVNVDSSPQHLHLAMLLQIVKLGKVYLLIRKLKHLSPNYFYCLSMLTPAMLVMYPIFFLGNISYCMACPDNKCSSDSWAAHPRNQEANSRGIPFFYGFYFLSSVASCMTLHDILPVHIGEYILVAIAGPTFCLLFVYVVGDLASTIIVARHRESKYDDIQRCALAFCRESGLNGTLEKRMESALDFLYNASEGHLDLFTLSSIDYIPNTLNEEMFRSPVIELLKCTKFFAGMRDEIIEDLAASMIGFVLPVAENVLQAGMLATRIYFLEKGWCRTYTWYNREGELFDHHEPFPIIEILLGIPNFTSVKTETACKFVSIDSAVFENIISKYADAKSEIYETVHRHFPAKKLEMLQSKIELNPVRTPKFSKAHSASFKYFGWAGSRKEEFWEGFRDTRFRCISHLFAPITVLPNGKFMLTWEISRILISILNSIIFPLSRVLRVYYWENVTIFLAFLDLTAVADIVVRALCAYYNDSGILVTHPLKTLQFYLKHSFALDVVATLPLCYVFPGAMTSRGRLHPLQAVAFANRALQLYRMRQLRTILTRMRMYNATISLMILASVLWLAAAQSVAAYLVYTQCAMAEGGIECVPGSWLEAERLARGYSPYNTMLFASLWAFSVTGASGIKVRTGSSGYLELGLTLAGYAGRIVLYALVASSRSSQDISLTDYQRKLRELLEFMKCKRMPKMLKQMVQEHFELTWKRRKGGDPHFIFRVYHPSLYYDVLYDMFQHQMRRCALFADSEYSVVRFLLRFVQHDLHVKRSRICRINDIVDCFFIVTKGSVLVAGADGHLLTKLGVGGVFGNLEPAPYSRQTVKVIAKTNVETVAMKTVTFVKMLSKYPEIKARYERKTLIHTDYLLPEDVDETIPARGAKKFKTARSKRFFHRFMVTFHPYQLTTVIFEHFIIVASLLNFCFTVYQVGRDDRSIRMIVVTYLFDVVYLFEIYFKFCRAYVDEYGEIVVDSYWIAVRYAKSWQLYVDLLSIIPLELVVLASGDPWIANKFRINRVLRIIYLFNFISKKCRKIGVNIFVWRYTFIFCVVLVTTHSVACINTVTYTSKAKTDNEIFSAYANDLYIAICLFTYSTLPNLNLPTAWELLYLKLALLVMHLVHALCIGWACALLKTINHKMDKYARAMKMMHEYLKMHRASEPLLKSAWGYASLVWDKRGGEQEPEMLADTPVAMREAIKNFLYRCRIRKHALFRTCHRDLLRQIILNTHQMLFFPGNHIAFRGDQDGCMYFIHFGEVEVYDDVPGAPLELTRTLVDGDIFGIMQGVKPGLAHEFTYQAKTLCLILTLRHDDWFHLLGFFPAAKIQILDRLKVLSGI